MLKTHTQVAIYISPNSYSCGACLVAAGDVREGRPGRARQMRRMVAKAKRRHWRETWAYLSERPSAQGPGRKAWKAYVKLTVAMSYAHAMVPAWHQWPDDVLKLHRETASGGAATKSPAYAIGVDLASEAPPAVIEYRAATPPTPQSDT